MKKSIVLSLLALFFAGQAYAVSVITGTWGRKPADKVYLFAVENGVLKETAASAVGDGGSFAFAVNATKPGFYVIGSDNRPSPMNKCTFYLKPGDKLNVAVDESTYTLTGDNSTENREMQRWHDLVLPIEAKSVYFMKNNSSYVDFFPLLEEKLEEIKAWKPTKKLDAAFAASFAKFRQFDLFNMALNFLMTPRSAHPQGDDYPEFFNTITLSAITSTPDILDFPYGLGLIQKTMMYSNLRGSENLTAEERRKFHDESLARNLPSISDKTVKGEVVLQQAGAVKTYAGLKDYEKNYGSYLTTDSQRERLKELIMSKAGESGQEAVDFTFKDATGKPVSLSDFKGKAVYVDVWATWCMPCRAEIPHLKKIEAEYEGKNIVFLGVSIDKESDHGKWKKFIVNEALPGVQLFAGDRKDEISKPYKITGIPRFMLFDKDGKVVTDSAPRPSSDEIRALLNSVME